MKMDLVKQLISEFEGSDVYKMKIEVEDLKLELEKAPTNVVYETPVVQQAPSTLNMSTSKIEKVVEEVPSINGTPIKSPIVGVFYPASSPTADPYVEVGSKVKKGQVLCIVEAMKVMNEIKSPIDGVVTTIMASADELVEFDQVLMMVEG